MKSFIQKFLLTLIILGSFSSIHAADFLGVYLSPEKFDELANRVDDRPSFSRYVRLNRIKGGGCSSEGAYLELSDEWWGWEIYGCRTGDFQIGEYVYLSPMTNEEIPQYPFTFEYDLRGYGHTIAKVTHWIITEHEHIAFPAIARPIQLYFDIDGK